jgi:hypothetical protein
LKSLSYRSKLYFTDLNLAKTHLPGKKITGSGASWSWLISWVEPGGRVQGGFYGHLAQDLIKDLGFEATWLPVEPENLPTPNSQFEFKKI